MGTVIMSKSRFHPRLKEYDIQEGDEEDLVYITIPIPKETKRMLKVAAFLKRMSMKDYVGWRLMRMMDKKFAEQSSWNIWKKALKGSSPQP